jgi:hypothetical protein
VSEQEVRNTPLNALFAVSSGDLAYRPSTISGARTPGTARIRKQNPDSTSGRRPASHRFAAWV